jgi:hypothetical protein
MKNLFKIISATCVVLALASGFAYAFSGKVQLPFNEAGFMILFGVILIFSSRYMKRSKK